MRILFVVAHYYPYIGGVEYVVKSIAERLTKMGHETIVLAGEPSNNQVKEEYINDVKVIRWPTQAVKDAYHIPRFRSKLKSILKQLSKDIDVIHIHSIHSILSIWTLREITKLNNVKKVLTPYYHGTGHTIIRRGLWKLWRPYVKNLIKKHVNIIHVVSKLEARLVERDFGIKPIVIENGVEEWIKKLHWNPQNYVMYSGRIEKYKNIHRLANILRIINSKLDIDFELRIFGDGSFKKSLNNYLNKLKIRYMLTSPQPFKVYIKYLSEASLFGLLSQKESYPQSINEANAIGVPVIIAKPWGNNFSERKRTLIVDVNKKDEELVKEVIKFIEKSKVQSGSEVPSWNQVINLYIKYLYN